MRRRRIATVLIGPSVLVREGLTKVLNGAGFNIVASASHVVDLIPNAGLKSQPELLIIDAGDDESLVMDEVGRFKQECPSCRVAVLANQHHSPSIVSAFRAGANACLDKMAPLDSVIKALELVMLGETILPAAMLPIILDNGDCREPEIIAPDVQAMVLVPQKPEAGSERDDTPPLSTREKFVLTCLLKGDCNKTIARELGIAEATVKVHVKAILRKVRVQNRTQAAIWAMKNGVLVLGAVMICPLLAGPI